MKILFLFLLFISFISAQQIKYDVSFPNAVHHEAEIKITISNVDKDTLKILMSRSSPGRYALHEFAKNIYNVKAEDENGEKLTVSWQNLNEWIVTGFKRKVIFSYTLFGDRADGTYSQINSEHAHLNIPAAFAWAEGLEDTPIEVHFNLPKEKQWKIATQLYPTSGKNVFTSPNQYYFMDSPVEISNIDMREWNVESGNKNYNIKLAVHHTEDTSQVGAFQKLVQAVIYEGKAIWGELPDYDYGTYTFLCDYVPTAVGDGMEHRNSTSLTSSGKISANTESMVLTAAHEFFHCWNVERLRPKSLEPFNFTETNISGELWFAEGFTEYYENLIAARAGIISLDRFSELIAKYVNIIATSPATNYFSLVEMSLQAPYVDAATSIDPNNRSNTFISYYFWGAAAGLALDLSLREKFPGVSLDDFMRLMWKEFGKPEIPYTNNDLKNKLSELTNNKLFADSFFEKYIFGKDIPDFKALLSNAGLLLTKAYLGETWAGKISFKEKKDGLYIDSYTLTGSPLFKAGLDKGDRVVKIDSTVINSEGEFFSALQNYSAGDEVVIEYEQNGNLVRSEIIFEETNTLKIIPFEHESLPVSEAVKEFRKSWLGSKAPEQSILIKFCPECKREFKFEYSKCPYDSTELKITN